MEVRKIPLIVVPHQYNLYTSALQLKALCRITTTTHWPPTEQLQNQGVLVNHISYQLKRGIFPVV